MPQRDNSNCSPEMLVEIPSRIDKVLDTGGFRYSIDCLQITPDPEDKDQVYAAGTDSRCMAITQLEGHAEREHRIPREVLPKKNGDAGCSVETKDGETYKFVKQKKTGNEIREHTPDPALAARRFPEVGDVASTIEGDHLLVSLDPEMVLRLADALGRNEEHRYCSLFVRIPEPVTLEWDHSDLCPEIREINKTVSPDRDEILLYMDLTSDGSSRNTVCSAVDVNRMDAMPLKLGTRVQVTLSRRQCGEDFVALAAEALANRAQMAVNIHNQKTEVPVSMVGANGIGVVMPCGGENPAETVGRFNRILSGFKAARSALNSVSNETIPDEPEEEPVDDEMTEDEQQQEDAITAVEELHAEGSVMEELMALLA